MPRWIELHDSTLEAMDAEPATLALRLRAYVHDWILADGRWRGSGWSQPVTMRLHEAASCPAPTMPVGLSGGWAHVGNATHDNAIPFPFASHEPTRIQLELVDGTMLDAVAEGIDIAPSGEPVFVEDLPDDLYPFDA